MRKQNRSCDQCRKSKRACDLSYASVNGAVSGALPSGDVRSCSYCHKTGKKCTQEWAAKQFQQLTSANGDSASRTKRKRSIAVNDYEAPPGSNVNLEPCPATLNDNLWSTSMVGIVGVFPPPTVPDLDVVTPSSHTGSWDAPVFQQTIDFPPPRSLSYGSSVDPLDATGYDLGNAQRQSSFGSIDCLESPQDLWAESNIAKKACNSEKEDEDGCRQLDKRHHATGNKLQRTRYSVSPFSSSGDIAVKSTKRFISSGLLKIYHDVLENNLTCWLTEATCPYRTGVDVYRETLRDSKIEWGSMWSNRIYGRTLELDRAASRSGTMHMSKSEDQAASRALNLAIVAFAAQWAQGSERQRETFGEAIANLNLPSISNSGRSDDIGAFDRRIQRELWEQARAALQQVSDVESFKVAAAEIIFGLAQKPLEREHEFFDTRDTEVFVCSNNDSLKSRISAKLSALFSREGPPVYMERAARKLQALKARFDSPCQGCGSHMSACGSKSTGARSCLSQENRTTINLLYWLAVMFDTISSTMNNRPVVVSDAESRPQVFPGRSQASTYRSDTDPTVGRWDVGYFVQDSMQKPSRVPIWPCSYEEAADAVIKSAPVKVLLFRHVSYLQSAIRNDVRGKPMEELVGTATSTYDYWQATYGSFFRSLVRDIIVIPFRIQSWFSCIAAHWHLAALMLSDIIDLVDRKELGTLYGSRNRRAVKTAANIRDQTITDLADLARVSTPSSDGQSPKTALNQEDFHHAVNGCVILTEPWTLILIKAFSSASATLLGVVEQIVKDGSQSLVQTGQELVSKLKMIEECVRALWHLGKKSDLSRRSAEILSMELNKLHVYIHGFSGSY